MGGWEIIRAFAAINFLAAELRGITFEIYFSIAASSGESACRLAGMTL